MKLVFPDEIKKGDIPATSSYKPASILPQLFSRDHELYS